MGRFYRFKIGQFNCISLSDGDMNYPAMAMFRDLSPERVQEVLAERGLPVTHVYSPYALLLIDTGSSKVLVDTGLGKYAQGTKEAFAGVDNSRTRAGIVLESLAEAGIASSEIETVIITHAHPDHIGGTFEREGRPNFANARFFISRAEWDFWFSAEAAARPQLPSQFVEVARTELKLLQNEINFLNGEEEIVPGVAVIPTPGHTPGHLAVQVESEDERLVHISDAVLLPIHLELPDVVPQFDVNPQQSLATRRRLCDQLAADKSLVFAHHFGPYPNLGYIEKMETGWRWCPYL
jgi:glyoxylase-like metal-dependent hydrolase (beta-lactamase superfamily II)